MLKWLIFFLVTLGVTIIIALTVICLIIITDVEKEIRNIKEDNSVRPK